MDIAILNEILEYVESEYRATTVIIESGQRKVYEATSVNNGGRFVLKICSMQPVLVARIKREIALLSELNSQYFPKFFFQFFVTDEVPGYFLDNLDPKDQQDKIKEIEAMKIQPFFVTVEEFIEHIPWSSAHLVLREEKSLITFLLHLFEGMDLLWKKKIVHRDLKPDNILLRPDFTPVIIDLGIAKNLSDGATSLTHPMFPSPCTPRFAAPEQITNNKAEVTYKTDQFSIGVISFMILTNAFPYGSDAEIGIEEVVKNFFTGKLDSIKKYNQDVSSETIAFVEKLLSVKPFQRYRTTDEIITILKSLKERL